MFKDTPLTFACTVDEAAGTRVYRLDGPITLSNLFELQAALRAGAPAPVTILDLSGVPYMDSAGMGMLINCHVHCQNQGAKLVVAGVSPRVMELFKMSRVTDVMTIKPSVEEALA